MNDRIFDLAKEADLIQWEALPSGARTPDHESVVKAKKFAELIVQECCDIFVELRTRPADLAVKDVKKHFGVEE